MMFTFDNDDDDLQTETTYCVRVRDGRTVTMTGDAQDLDEITAMMRKTAAAPGLLAVCEEVAAWIDEPGKGRALLYPHLADVILPKLKAAIAAAKGEATPKPVYPCEMCGTDTGDAKNIHRALAQDGNTYQVCNHCASQTHRWQEVNA